MKMLRSVIALDPHLFGRGRFFMETEDTPSGARSLVLGYDFWQRRFRSDRDVVGRTIEFNGEPWRVVGILAPNFDFYGRINHNNDFFIPLGRMSEEELLADRQAPRVSVIGRLKEGVRLEAAAREMEQLGRRLAGRHPESQTGRRILDPKGRRGTRLPEVHFIQAAGG